MTVKTITIQFAATAEEEPMAVVRNAMNNELLSVWSGNAVSELYYQLIRRNMGADYNDLRAIRPPEESPTEHS